jgi:hypothetical protein
VGRRASPDKLALANTLLNLGQFLLNATNGGYRVDVKQLSDRFGVTLVEAELPALQLARVQQTKPAATATTPDATQSTEQRAA